MCVCLWVSRSVSMHEVCMYDVCRRRMDNTEERKRKVEERKYMKVVQSEKRKEREKLGKRKYS